MRQFVAWATASWERYARSYRTDAFFRTAAHIILLQAGFVCVCALAFAWAAYTDDRLVLALLPASAVGAGAILIRLSLRPARDTLRYQKLFISNIAHELRTPLSTIKTDSEVALMDDKLNPDLRATFLEIVGELNRVSEIINNLLSLNSLSRPERMQFKSLDVVPMAEEVVGRHMALARERGIKLTLRSEVGSIALANATGLEQVMSNLVKNALSYTPTESRGHVMVSVRPQEDMVAFVVEDSGIGMSQEELLHVFEPFYRADSSRNRALIQGGSGLGLTIVNEMVRAHRGKIHIESRRGGKNKQGGTTVTVFLPRGGAALQDEVNKTSLDFSRSRIAG